MKTNTSYFVAIIFCICYANLHAADYHVGPSQAQTSLEGIAWSSLKAGDTVYIHAKPNQTPYHEKLTISGVGTQANPIRIIGVADASGNLPIIDGQNASTPSSCYWRSGWLIPNQYQIEDLGLIFLNVTDTTLPQWIEIKNLEIRNCYPTNTFTARDGTTVKNYNGFAAGIRIHGGRNVLIENCKFDSNAQGIFIKEGGADVWWDVLAKDITIRGCWFTNNGLYNNYGMHQTYVQGENITVEYCRYSANRSTALGSHHKSRTAGDIIRYNLFEAPAASGFVIDMVEPEDPFDSHFASLSTYKQTHVYGNIFNLTKTANFMNWGEDHEYDYKGRWYNGGKLLFYNNTVYIKADIHEGGWYPSLYLFHTKNGGYENCPSEVEHSGSIDLYNNIINVVPSSVGGTPVPLILTRCTTSKLVLGNNWISPGYTAGATRITPIGVITSPSDDDPGFVDATTKNFRLRSTSSARGISGASAPEVTSNYLGLNLTAIHQYKENLTSEPRLSTKDLGAYEFSSVPSPPLKLRIP
jgi:hypothetical protein